MEVWQEKFEEEEQFKGISGAKLASPTCPYCYGTGYIKLSSQQFSREDICQCVIENKRKYSVEQQVKQIFGKGQLSMTLANYDPGNKEENIAIHEGCVNYVENFPTFFDEGIGFILEGNAGSGKTHLAVGTLMAIIKRWSLTSTFERRRLQAIAISVPELFQLARERFNNPNIENVISTIMRADICLIDDIGAEKTADKDLQNVSWVTEQLYIILNYRINNNLPSLITTNHTTREISNKFDDRVSRRIVAKSATIWKPVRISKYLRPKKDYSDLLARPTKFTRGAS